MAESAYTFDQALAAYDSSERPPLCPRCGGWDGPRLPFCTDRGWSHKNTCARYSFALDVCSTCEVAMSTPPGETV